MIGRSVERQDAWAKVLGEARYPGDLNLPDQVHMKVLFAGRPHAVIRRIDTTAAEALPGVLAILTAKDVPVNEYGYVFPDQPVLCGPGSAKAGADRVRFVGDQIALVIAETEAIAAEARRRIEVSFEDLPVVTDPETAMRPGAPQLHPDRERNLLSEIHIARGDAEDALRRAEVVIEGEYRTPAQEHAYLQPEAGVAYVDGEGRVTVQVAGQWMHKDRRQIAHALGLPEERIRVVYPAIGGAFGGREDVSIQIVLALAAWRLHQGGLNRPVKLIWTREESILGHAKRHPYLLRARWGATCQGRVMAAQCEFFQDAGAYAYTSSKILPTTALMLTGPYDIAHVKIDGYSAFTNHIPNGAVRGFGAPQGAFVAEMQMNRLAQALRVDPVQLRRLNLLREGGRLSVNTPIPDAGQPLDRVLVDCAARAGWQQDDGAWRRPADPIGKSARARVRRGTGIACAFKNIGFSWGAPEGCEARVELHGGREIETAVVRVGAADLGQGVHSTMRQMAAEVLGLPMERIQVVAEDTAESPDAGSASASRLTFMTSNAIHGAAQLALQRWVEEDRPAIASFVYRPPQTTAYDAAQGQATPYIAYGYVAEAVTVEVDEETGHIQLVDVVCADDVGRAINPQQVLGQINGAVIQAAGYSLLEDFKQEGGWVQTPNLSTYLIPTVFDIPGRVETVLLETPTPRSPWGARGVGEMPYVPLAAAIAAAVHDATSVWFGEFPLTPERVWRGLRESAGKDSGGAAEAGR